MGARPDILVVARDIIEYNHTAVNRSIPPRGCVWIGSSRIATLEFAREGESGHKSPLAEKQLIAVNISITRNTTTVRVKSHLPVQETEEEEDEEQQREEVDLSHH